MHVRGAKSASALNLQLKWTVLASIFHKISASFGALEIDLFASRVTALLSDYVS